MDRTGASGHVPGMNALDEILRDADPGVVVDDKWTSAVYSELMSGKTSRRSRRWAWPALPILAIGALALTGAGVVVALALGQLGVNGNSVDYDVTVPIEYSDTQGVTHSCSYGFYVGDGSSKSPEAQQLVDWLEDRDWEGVGQEVYNYADERQADGIEGPADFQHQAGFTRALNEVLYRGIPTELLTGGTVLAGSSNCDGEGLSW